MMLKVKIFIFLLCATGIGVLFSTYSPNSTDWFQNQNQSLCACDKCLTEDNVLRMHRLNSFVQPFLSAQYNLSQDAFNWWKRLQNEQGSFSTYKTTVKSLFQILPPNPDVVGPSPDRCRSCAVVGNSANLKGSCYGPPIDFHDVIIRINDGPVKGFEEDVGTRTTHRIMYPESAIDLDNSTHLVLFPFKLKDLEWVMKAVTTGFTGVSYAPVKSKINANKNLVMVLNPAFMRYVHDMWLDKKGRYPSTGFMTLVLALHICDEVHVFGFGADSDGNWSHYWQELRNKKLKTGVHSGQHEYGIIQRLAQQGKLRFYKRS